MRWPDRCHSTDMEFMDSRVVYVCLREGHLLDSHKPGKKQSIPILKSKALKFSLPGHYLVPQDEDTVEGQSSVQDERDVQQTLRMGH